MTVVESVPRRWLLDAVLGDVEKNNIILQLSMVDTFSICSREIVTSEGKG